jgi:GH25 family lysozyme M1 (1,4-beta-N-acetylmuramidase)
MRHLTKTLAVIAVVLATFAPVITASAATPACATWLRLADISSNNPHPIDFASVVKSGVAGVYIKVTEGTNYSNPYFAQDVKGAVKSGLPYGAYDYALPSGNPIADAKYFVSQGGAKGQLPPALDFETQTKSPSHDLAWALVWLNEVKLLTGKTPIIYTGSYYSWSGAISLSPWALWLAAYPLGYKPVNSACGLTAAVTPSGWSKAHKGWSIWQFTSRAKVSGIGAYADLSVALPSWFTEIMGTGVVPATPKHPVATPLYAPGSHGVTVTYVQTVLFSLNLIPKSGITGKYDLQTKVAVEKYQVLMGVPADGLWGITTSTANIWYLANRRPVETLANYPLMQVGTAFHSQVRFVQERLNFAGAHLAVDGVFSTLTEQALIKFQKKHKVTPYWYGKTDITTWRALWSA